MKTPLEIVVWYAFPIAAPCFLSCNILEYFANGNFSIPRKHAGSNLFSVYWMDIFYIDITNCM